LEDILMSKKPTYEELEQKVKELEREASERKQAEDALREDKEELEAVFHAVGEGIAIFDKTGRVTKINKRIVEVGGYSEKEVIGKRLAFLKMLPRESIARMLRNFTKLISGERTSHFEVEVYTKAGKKLDVELQGSPLRKKGKIIGMVGVMRDITDQKQMEAVLVESERQKEYILDSLVEHVIHQDMDMRIQWANRAACESAGMSRENLIGRYCYEIWPKRSDPCPDCPVREAITVGQLHETEKSTPDGRAWYMRGYPLRDSSGTIVGGTELTLEITERMQAEKALGRRAEEFAALYNTSLEITRPHELPVLLETIVERAVRLLNGTGGGMYLCDPDKEEARCVVSYRTPRDFTGTVLKYGEGAAGTVAQRGEPMIIDDYRTWSGRATVFEEEQPFTAVISIPMTWQDDVIGVIHVMDNGEKRRFTADDLELLNLFGHQAVIAIQNARLVDKVQGHAVDLERINEELYGEIEKGKTAEKALRLSERKFRALAEQSPNMIFINQKGRIVYVNDRCEEVMGYTNEEFYSEEFDFLTLIAPEYRESISRNFSKHMSGMDVEPCEYALITKDGRRVEAIVATRLIDYGGGRAILGTATDITERMRAENLIRTQRDLALALSATSGLGEGLRMCLDGAVNVSGMDCGGVYLFDKAPGVLELVLSKGLSADFVRSATHYDTDSANVRLVMRGEPIYTQHLRLGVRLDEHKRAERLGAIAVLPFHHRDHVIGCLNIASHTLNEVPAFAREALESIAAQMGGAIARLEAMDALRQSEEKYRTILESIEESYYEVDIAGNLTFFNDSTCNLLGYARDELIGMNNRQLMDQENAKKVYQTFNKVYSTGEPAIGSEWEIIRKDGTKRIFDASVSLIEDAEGRPIGFHGILRDITRRKQAEEALQQEKERFRILVEESPLGVSLIGADGTYKYINPTFKEIFSYALEDIPTGREWFRSAYPDPEYRHQVISTWITDREASKAGEVRLRIFTVRCKDGSEKQIQFRSVTMENRDQLVIYEDTTERTQLEAQLQHAQRMEAIGTLAGGIAHDFNNILSAIIGYTEIALFHELSDGTRVHKSMEQVLAAGQRAKDLVKQILAFSRQAEEERRPVRLDPIVREALKLLRASLPSTIEIRQYIAPDMGYVMADPTQIHQVLMNLCTNAHHAMIDTGGVLEVRLESTTIDAFEAASHDLSPGLYLALVVSDTGHGMSPEVVERIFDPYFTTKEKDVGTGLGLAVVHGIVKSYRGAISVKSEPGDGTTFTVYLPRIETEKLPKEAAGERFLPTGDERILLIDDEPTLVDIGRQMLHRLGYQVVTRTSSTEALELFRSAPDEFDLIITDQTMPHMPGDELAKELMKLRPSMPIILCTGFSERISEQEAKSMGIKAFLMKPVVFRDLAATIRKVLEEE
jgi:PAS domain S-box-containing protein